MNSSVLWVASPPSPRTGAFIRKLRESGLLPVRVESVDDALHLLGQFRAGVVVYQAAAPEAWNECMRLAATSSPVVALVPDPTGATLFASAGCVAVVVDSCSETRLVEVVRTVARDSESARFRMQNAHFSGKSVKAAG